MKSMKTNGQVLSEKEMKEEKGGNKFTSDRTAVVCPVCGCPVLLVVGGEYTCQECGGIITEEELEESSEE